MQSILQLVANDSVALSTLQDKMRRILGVKYDLGLFDNPYIPDDIDPDELTAQHVPLTLEAAQKSIVLLENRGSILPLNLADVEMKKLALIGPFSDIVNYGDYSGQFGEYPVAHSSTLRQGIVQHLHDANSRCELVSAWGANTWSYNAQYAIPSYHLSAHGTVGGLQATYFADVNFTIPTFRKVEAPVRDWGLYPPPGLPSNNFSIIWEGTLVVPTSVSTNGYLGVAIAYNSTAKLYVDDQLLVSVPSSKAGNILSNIPSRAYTLANSTSAPPGSAPFTFFPGAKHRIRLEFQSWNTFQKIENESSLNAEILLFWNLVERISPVEQAVTVAQDADIIILALGGTWNSDAENADRGTMGLSRDQTDLANAILALEKPTILVIEGGRPFAISEMYNRSTAVLNAYFGGQSGGQAIADVLFGRFNPGGRLPLTVPRHVGQMPVYYNFKRSAHQASYVDIDSTPAYPFGYGLSYTNFSIKDFRGNTYHGSNNTFGAGAVIHFSVELTNTGAVSGSYVTQLYLLQRVSQISQPVKQLVTFKRTYLEPGESRTVTMQVDVDRYLRILNRRWQWELEKGQYTFALLENGSIVGDTSVNVTMHCTGGA